MNSVEVVIGARASEAAKTVIDLSKKLGQLAESAGKAAKSVLNFGKTLTSAALGLGKYKSGLSKIVDAFKRIVFYRAIRSAIREITQGFKEGTDNLYQYSRALGGIDASNAVGTMNELATVSLYIKNSLGAMVMPILQALVPIISAVADAFVTAANAVNMFFQALKGQTVFTKAKKYAVDYADGLGKASGAAKELKKQTFGFDELNIFNAPSGGGGGGGAAMDYSKMFEEADVSDFMQNLKQMMEEGEWKQVGAMVADRLNEIVANFDAAGFGSNIGTKLRHGLDLAVGFLMTFNFAQVGEKIAVALNKIISKINFNDIGALLGRKFTAIVEFAIGFLTTFDFGGAAEAISGVIVGCFDHLSDWLLRVDWETFGKTFFQQVYDFVTGIDFGAIASSLFDLLGVALGSALQLFKGFVDGLFEKVMSYFKRKTEECGGNIILGILKGILDAVVGIAAWIYDNIFTPFVNGILEAFGIENGLAVPFKEIGDKVIMGFLDGLMGAWKLVAGWITTVANGVKNTFNAIIEGVKNFKPESKRSLDFRVNTGYYAEGGQPPQGSLFWAGESGAELVGQVGGRTTVTTHDQFSEGMANIMDNTNTIILQAAQTVVQAVLSKDMTVINNISDRAIVNAYDRGKRLGGTGLAVGSGIV